MYKYFFILYFLVLASCSTRKDSDKNQLDSEVHDVLHAKIIPDSLFYKGDVMMFKASDATDIMENEQENLVSIGDELMKKLSTCLGKDGQLLNGYFYSNYKNLGDIHPMVFLVNKRESSSFIFLTLDKHLTVVSCIELTWDRCDLVDQDDEKEIIWCDTREAFFSDDNKFKLITEHIERIDFQLYSEIKKDSIASIYSIKENGSLLLTKRDSVRVDEKINSH